MIKSIKIILIIGLALVISGYAIYLYWYGAIVEPVSYTGGIAQETGLLVTQYIQNNQGHFPSSEDGWIKQCLVEDTNYCWDMAKTTYRPLKLLYGVKVEDLKKIDGKLYNKATNEQVLLIDGPYQKYLKEQYYEPISLHWYELMLSEKQKAESSTKEPNNPK